MARLCVHLLLLTGFLAATSCQGRTHVCAPCGKFPVPYPLSTSSSCGHPLYKVTCTPENKLELHTLSGNYTVESLDPRTATMVVSTGAFLGDSCITEESVSSHNFSLFPAAPLFIAPGNTIMLFNASDWLKFSPLKCSNHENPCLKALHVLPQLKSCRSSLCCSFVTDADFFRYGFPLYWQDTGYVSVMDLADPMSDASRWTFGLRLQWEVPREPPCATQVQCGGNSTCRASSGPPSVPFSGSPANATPPPLFSCLCDKGFIWDPITGSCNRDPIRGLTGARNTSKDKSCIGSLCGTRSKLMSILMPLAVVGMVFLVLAFLALNMLCRHWCDGESGGDETLKLEKIQGLTGNPISFPYATLASATKSFTIVLGQGGFGIVYKGVLPSGEAVAVKVLNQSTHTEQQFLREIEILGKLHHVNVVRLVGFCIEKSKKILVYEFISNSSLEKHLFDNSKNAEEMDSVLSWEKRYEIALGVARGLSYIHEECQHQIIHRDMKPHNILLDDLFCPKISDFGLAKIIKREESKVVSGLKGTPGYMAPEFWRKRRGELSTKSDIYGFGMVALELVSGRPNFKGEISSELACLLECAFANVSSPGSIIDYRIANQANLSQVKSLVLVALWCIQEDPARRPSMSRVVQYLEGSIDVPANPPQPHKGVNQGNLCSSSVAIVSSKSSYMQGR